MQRKSDEINFNGFFIEQVELGRSYKFAKSCVVLKVFAKECRQIGYNNES